MIAEFFLPFALKITLILFALSVASYLIGSISFARIIAKIRGIDITNQGSGNPGTMNMLRTFGFWLGLSTFILDILKGFLPALAGYLLYKYALNEDWSHVALYTCGVAALLGHLYPLYYKFKGGKGVATTMGIFFCSHWFAALGAVLLGIIYIYFREYGGIGSLIMIFSAAAFEIVWFSVEEGFVGFKLAYLLCIISLLLLVSILKHRSNLHRMANGTENKTSLRAILKRKKSEKSNE